jgi:uncharacterized protein YcfJ
MKKLIFALALISATAMAREAEAVGCISGGLAGGAAGHMAGHTILGALGGCVAGHLYHKHQLSQQDLQNKQAYDAAQNRAATTTRSQYPNQYTPPNSPPAYGR